jgi:hypothetical protein
MFIARKSGVLPESVLDADHANGIVHICDQSVLMFGSDRRDPTASRPVVAIRKDGLRIVVLPCTTKDSTALPDFFELTKDRVMWKQSSEVPSSFAYRRYEVVAADRLTKEIGIMPHSARLDLLTWLKSRY